MDLFRVCEQINNEVRDLGLHAAEIQIKGIQLSQAIEVKGIVVKFTRMYGIPEKQEKKKLIEQVQSRLCDTEWKVIRSYQQTDEKGAVEEMGIRIDLQN